MTKRTLAPQDASSAFDDVVALLGPPPLLSTEDPQIYHDLLSRVVRAAGPRHMIEWILGPRLRGPYVGNSKNPPLQDNGH